MFTNLASFYNLASLGAVTGPSPQNEQNPLKTLEKTTSKKDTGHLSGTPNGHHKEVDPSVRSVSMYLDDRPARGSCFLSEPDLDASLA